MFDGRQMTDDRRQATKYKSSYYAIRATRYSHASRITFHSSRFWLLSLLVALVLASTPLAAGRLAASPTAQSDSRLFPETGKSVRGKFLTYWNAHGGLPQQGFPISEEIQEKSETNGKIETRAR